MNLMWTWITLWMMSLSQPVSTQPDRNERLEQATLGAGCFWCVEAVFQRVQGVVAVEAGYTGGDWENPTYRQVVSGRTGHAEVARVTFDPERISFEEILEVFWHTHNPTTLNRQGADVGPQYRSAIFYHDEEQREIAEASLERTDASDLWSDPIVTEVTSLGPYYRAENYHQDYFNNNPNAGYCQVVIAPKLKKLRDDFPQLWQESIE